jgi:hypothetical protein
LRGFAAPTAIPSCEVAAVCQLRHFASVPTRAQNTGVPPETEAALHALRMRYKAVFTAHQDCVRALTEATMSGASATPELLAKEMKARQELAETRAALLAAIAEGEPSAV